MLFGALEAMHARKLIHGDIHFDNVFWVDDNTAVLNDFASVRPINADPQRAEKQKSDDLWDLLTTLRPHFDDDAGQQLVVPSLAPRRRQREE
jgi:RIO-like serine/threonine protein kinase